MKPAEFINAIADGAKRTSVYGIPASFSIAQAALESNWGNSQLAIKGKNLFAIKATSDWKGRLLYMQDSAGQMACWRAYQTWDDSIADHAAFLVGNERYKRAFETKTVEDFAVAVQAAGYAGPDKDYAKNIIEIIDTHSLKDYDPRVKEKAVDSGFHPIVGSSVVAGAVTSLVISLLKAKAGIDLTDQAANITTIIMAATAILHSKALTK